MFLVVNVHVLSMFLVVDVHVLFHVLLFSAPCSWLWMSMFSVLPSCSPFSLWMSMFSVHVLCLLLVDVHVLPCSLHVLSRLLSTNAAQPDRADQPFIWASLMPRCPGVSLQTGESRAQSAMNTLISCRASSLKIRLPFPTGSSSACPEPS